MRGVWRSWLARHVDIVEVIGSNPITPTTLKKMINKNKLYYLYYNKKLSVIDIAKKLGVTPATISYWMDKYSYRRRNQSESAYVKQNAFGDPFDIKKKLTPKEKELFIAGLMLYWSEGAKSQKYVARLGNLDGKMLQVFLKFLRKICRIDESRLRLQVRVYQKFDREKAKAYWAKLLKMPQNNISVHPHTDKRSNVIKQWSPYGIATLEFCNMKFRQWLDKTISEYANVLIR